MEKSGILTQDVTPEETTRRTLLRLTGIGLVGGFLANVFGPRPAYSQGIAHAMWVHGINLKIENPGALETYVPLGWGMELAGKNGQQCWIHFAIPTSVIVSDTRLKVGSVIVDFSAEANARIKEIAVWDGGTKLIEHQGTFSGLQSARVNIPAKPEVRFGINISVLCGWGVETGNKITFHSAGVDFYS